MSVWMWSGQMAVLLGGIGFLAVFIPLVARQYRKFGRLSGRRLLVSGGVSLYLTGGTARAGLRTLEGALELAVEVESLARVYWQALQVGEPALLDAAAMALVHARFGRYRPDRPDA